MHVRFILRKKEEFYKLLPANKADHLCQLWQSCSDLHKIQTVYDNVKGNMRIMTALCDQLILEAKHFVSVRQSL